MFVDAVSDVPEPPDTVAGNAGHLFSEVRAYCVWLVRLLRPTAFRHGALMQARQSIRAACYGLGAEPPEPLRSMAVTIRSAPLPYPESE